MSQWTASVTFPPWCRVRIKADELRRRLTKPGQVDLSETGITFVDVLFALVVTEGLEPLRRWESRPADGRWHLTVAAVLTLTSWIGYHTSKNRPKYEIRFLNWPLAQFVLDVLMVVVYWIAITTYEKSRDSMPSAWPEALLVSVAFGLYVLWDLVGWRIRKSHDYGGPQVRPGDWWRRGVTMVATAVAVGLAIAAGLAQRNDWADVWVYRIDVGLIVLLVLYRIAKELVSPAQEPQQAPERCPFCGCPSAKSDQ